MEGLEMIQKRSKISKTKYKRLARPDLSFENVFRGKIVACVSFLELVSRAEDGPTETRTIFIPIHEEFARISTLLHNGIEDINTLNPGPVSPMKVPTSDAIGSHMIHPSFRGSFGLASVGEDIVPIDRATLSKIMTFPISGKSVATFVEMLGVADMVCGAPKMTADAMFSHVFNLSKYMDIETLHSVAQIADFFDVSFDVFVCSDQSPAGKTLTKLCAMIIGQKLYEGCAGVPRNGMVGYMKNSFSFLGIP